MPAPATLALFALATALLTLPQFLNPTEPIAPQVAVLGVIYVAIAIVVDTTYVLTASAVSRRFNEQPRGAEAHPPFCRRDLLCAGYRRFSHGDEEALGALMVSGWCRIANPDHH
jgi:hypothetical protein